jgi:hypothetical protein
MWQITTIYYYSQLTHLTISFSDAACTFILLYMCSILSKIMEQNQPLHFIIIDQYYFVEFENKIKKASGITLRAH